MRKYLILEATLLLALASILFGCAPYINSYYLPDSQDGHRSGHSTLTSGAPIWILERKGATFKFSARKEQNGKTIFTLNIQPLHTEAEISLSAKVREEARARVKPITVGLENTKDGVSVIINDATDRAGPIRVVKGTYGTNNRHSVESISDDLRIVVDQYLSLSAEYKSTKAGSYVVGWPVIMVNQQEVVLPPIEFHWKVGVQVQFLNG
jgi:hypothetical protein